MAKLKISAPSEKQVQFLKARTKHVGFGGARGGGKSWAVRTKAKLLALRYSGIRILIVRRTYPELINNHIKILRLELLTGKVEILIEEEGICSASALLANCVVYYIREAGDVAEVCRLYIPEKRVDVLYEIEHPAYLFPGSLRVASSTLGSISWYGLNPEIVEKAEALWAEPNPGKIIGGYDYTDSWKNFSQGISGMGQDFREMFFWAISLVVRRV